MRDRTGVARRFHLLAAACAVLSALALTGCGGGGDGGTAPATSRKTVALVTPQKAGDNGPTDNLIAGLNTLKAAGYSTRFVAAPDPSSHESTLRSLAQAGTQVIAVSFSDFTQAVKAVAPQFPKTKFVHVYADPYEPTIPNVQTVAFDTRAPSYLAGALAATLSKTKTVGFIGGTAIPPLFADFHAFEAGAKATEPGITVKSAFVGSFGDPVKGQQIAQTMFNNKVDVVLAYAGGSSTGVVKAATQAGTHVIYDNAESPDTAASVIAVASQHYGDVMARSVKTIGDGTWKAGGITAGLADDGTFLNRAKQFKSSTVDLDGAFQTVEKIKQQIIEGKIHVPFNTKAI
jgi:basic membrane protein A